MPITPVEILMVNLVTSVLLSIGLAFEAPEPDIMRPPRRPDASLLSPLFVRRIVLVSVLMRAGTFGLFLAVTRAGGSVEDGRTAAVDALVLFECVHLLNPFDPAAGRRPRRRAQSADPARHARGAREHALSTYLPVSQRIFATTSIGAEVWAAILAVAALVFVALEIEKAVMRRCTPAVTRGERRAQRLGAGGAGRGGLRWPRCPHHAAA